MKEWFDVLMLCGPQFGYFPEQKKRFLVVHDSFFREAEKLFDGYGLRVVSCKRFLGGLIGDRDDEIRFVDEKVEEWMSELKVFSMIGGKQPQVAYSALVKSLQCKWNFVQRVTQAGSSSYRGLEKLLTEDMLPKRFGTEITEEERDLFALPTRFGGLGIFNPAKKSEQSYVNSRCSCQKISEAIKGLIEFDVQSH